MAGRVFLPQSYDSADYQTYQFHKKQDNKMHDEGEIGRELQSWEKIFAVFLMLFPLNMLLV